VHFINYYNRIIEETGTR